MNPYGWTTGYCKDYWKIGVTTGQFKTWEVGYDGILDQLNWLSSS